MGRAVEMVIRLGMMSGGEEGKGSIVTIDRHFLYRYAPRYFLGAISVLRTSCTCSYKSKLAPHVHSFLLQTTSVWLLKDRVMEIALVEGDGRERMT